MNRKEKEIQQIELAARIQEVKKILAAVNKDMQDADNQSVIRLADFSNGFILHCRKMREMLEEDLASARDALNIADNFTAD